MTDTAKPDACREAFERWYIENAFDYVENPIGSRECGLQRKAWRAAWNARAPVTAPSGAIGYINAGWMQHRKGVTRIYPDPHPRVATSPVYAEPPAQQSEEKRDAERYRWLRGPDHESTRYSRWRIEHWDGPRGWQPVQRESMDAAVDAARADAGDAA